MSEFLRELEIFRTEEESAQQFFFAYLSVRALAAENPDVALDTPFVWPTGRLSIMRQESVYGTSRGGLCKGTSHPIGDNSRDRIT
jgi:hypothetical protein